MKLLLLLALVLSVFCSTCKDFSYVHSQGRAMLAMPYQNYQTLTSIQTATAIAPVWWPSVVSSHNGYFVGTAFCYPNDDFYEIVNCNSYVYGSEDECQQAAAAGYQWVFTVVNKAIFGNKVIHSWYLGNDGIVVSKPGADPAKLGAFFTFDSYGDFNCTTRGWYNLADGAWTGTYDFVGGGSGDTMVRKMTACTGTIMLDRDNAETCEPMECMRNSVATNLAPKVCAMTMGGTDLASNAAALLNVVKTLADVELPRVYVVGFGQALTNNYYDITSCKNTFLGGDSFCTLAGNPDWYFTARDASLFGNKFLHMFRINSNTGVIDSTAFAIGSTEFNTTQRTWFKQRWGWTLSYTFVDSGKSGQSFTCNTQNGNYVAAAIRIDGESCILPVPRTTPVSAASRGFSMLSLLGLMVLCLAAFVSIY